MLQCTHDMKAVVLDHNPSIKSIGRGALTGAMILGGIGALLGLLVGVGIIGLPSLEPSASQALPFPITWQFILAATLSGMLLGRLTGAILGQPPTWQCRNIERSTHPNRPVKVIYCRPYRQTVSLG